MTDPGDSSKALGRILVPIKDTHKVRLIAHRSSRPFTGCLGLFACSCSEIDPNFWIGALAREIGKDPTQTILDVKPWIRIRFLA